MIIDFTGFNESIMKELRHNSVIAISAFLNKVKEPVRKIIEDSLKASPEYQSIFNGDLQQQFGLANPQEALDGIVRAIKEAIIFEPRPGHGDILGEIFIGAFQEDFADALSSPEASYHSHSFTIDWLLWYLTRGGSMVVADYRIMNDGSPLQNSRAGTALMVKSSNMGWSAPEGGPAWIERCASEAEAYVFGMLEKEIANGLYF